MKLFIDVETFSSADLKAGGIYPYMESPDFQILLAGYAIDEGPVKILDLTEDREEALATLSDLLLFAEEVIAHNAAFERNAFRRYGIDRLDYFCTMVKAAYCGLPLSLDEAGKALGLPIQKDAGGKALIRYFSLPCKPTKANGGRLRNLPEHDPEKWQAFKDYLRDDVATTRELYKALEKYPYTEQANYELDQKINDRGVRIDAELVKNAIQLNDETTRKLTVEVRRLTGITNPNSPAQLIKWLNANAEEEVDNLTAATVEDLLKRARGDVRRVLQFRKATSNTSVKKYEKALSYLCADGRARGLFQFYGAGRTGRWAGRGIQLQNMPRNYLKTLTIARDLVRSGDFETLEMLYEDPQDALKQLTRTMLVPREGYTFLIADFSAIEARVIAWLAGEKWRLEVFATHGKIYEASASMMFGVAIEEVTKGSEYRQKGKIAELALGYQGGVNALKTMGGEAMGLTESEMQIIVTSWRKANPAIKSFWSNMEAAAVRAMKHPNKRIKAGAVSFLYDHSALLCFLPSGRPLIYQKPKLVKGKFGDQIRYLGADQKTGRWTWLDTYGGKLVENIVQAVARDLLAFSLHSVEAAGYKTVLHVHDEIVVEAQLGADVWLKDLLEVMTRKPSWAEGLPLAADGFVAPFYQKD